jgi:uncharacterized membrane protein YbhN (UPF0104 family)
MVERMKKTLTRLLKAVLFVLIGYFVVVELRKQHFSPMQIWHYLLHANLYFYASLGVFTLFLMMQAWIWVQILNRPTFHLDALKGMVIYINSQFVKYMPGGGVLNFLGRFYMTSKEGVPMQRQLMTLVHEGILLVLAATVYSVILTYTLHWIPIYGLLGMVVLAGVLYVYYNRFNEGMEKLIQRYVKRFRGFDLKLPRKDFFTIWFFFLISHLIMGISFDLLLRSFGVHGIGLLYATGTFALAWLIGIAVPVPGGLGVREAVLVYVLHRLGVEVSLATQISIITRIWNILGEIVFFFVINGFSLLREGLVHKRES